MNKWYKIEYFHPDGKSMPNGICYQRGWFSKECRDNMDAFALKTSDDVRAILILPSQEQETSSWHKHLFRGRFVHNGVTFDSTSRTLEIRATYANKAREEASEICKAYNVSTAIMKWIPTKRWYNLFFDKTPRFYFYQN